MIDRKLELLRQTAVNATIPETEAGGSQAPGQPGLRGEKTQQFSLS